MNKSKKQILEIVVSSILIAIAVLIVQDGIEQTKKVSNLTEQNMIKELIFADGLELVGYASYQPQYICKTKTNHYIACEPTIIYITDNQLQEYMK